MPATAASASPNRGGRRDLLETGRKGIAALVSPWPFERLAAEPASRKQQVIFVGRDFLDESTFRVAHVKQLVAGQRGPVRRARCDDQFRRHRRCNDLRGRPSLRLRVRIGLHEILDRRGRVGGHRPRPFWIFRDVPGLAIAQIKVSGAFVLNDEHRRVHHLLVGRILDRPCFRFAVEAYEYRRLLRKNNHRRIALQVFRGRNFFFAGCEARLHLFER